MVCESWKATLDTYLDGEVPREEMRTFDAQCAQLPLLLGGRPYTPTDEACDQVAGNVTPPALSSGSG